MQLPEPSLPDEPQDLGRDFLDESHARPSRPTLARRERHCFGCVASAPIAPLPDVDAGSPLEERFAPLAFVEAIPDDWLAGTGRGQLP